MPLFRPAQTAAARTVGRRTGFFFRGIFRLRILFILMFVLFIYAVVISIEAGSIQPAIDELGPRFITPTQEIQDISRETIANQGYWKPGNTLSNIWGIFSIILSFYVLFFWIYTLAFIWSLSPISNKAESFTNFFLAIASFIIIQIIYLLYINKNFWLPLEAMWDFSRALKYFIQPVVEVADKFIGNESAVKETINTST